MPTLRGKRLHPHSMRHSTAVHLLRAGVDIVTISQWLGHASVTTTHRYATVDLDMKRTRSQKRAPLPSTPPDQPVAHRRVRARMARSALSKAVGNVECGDRIVPASATWPRQLHITDHSTFVDEVGYLGYDARAADLIFQLVSRRYEHRSLLITTNLPFKRWDTVFPNASCAVALIDRLTHHAEILLLEGQSYRRREAELSQQERNRQRPARDEDAE